LFIEDSKKSSLTKDEILEISKKIIDQIPEETLSEHFSKAFPTIEAIRTYLLETNYFQESIARKQKELVSESTDMVSGLLTLDVVAKRKDQIQTQIDATTSSIQSIQHLTIPRGSKNSFIHIDEVRLPDKKLSSYSEREFVYLGEEKGIHTFKITINDIVYNGVDNSFSISGKS